MLYVTDVTDMQLFGLLMMNKWLDLSVSDINRELYSAKLFVAVQKKFSHFNFKKFSYKRFSIYLNRLIIMLYIQFVLFITILYPEYLLLFLTLILPINHFLHRCYIIKFNISLHNFEEDFNTNSIIFFI